MFAGTNTLRSALLALSIALALPAYGQTKIDINAQTKGTLAAARVALDSRYQPSDSDLTAIAQLSTTSYGRAFLALANAAAARTALALGTAATSATGDFDAAGAAAAAQAASQPLDSDLSALAALNTTSYGRSLLEAANAAAGRTLFALDNVTNDAQTKAAIVPNTAPTAGQVLAGNAGGTAYAPVSVSGDCTLSSAGAQVCTKTNGTTLGALATVTPGTGVTTALAVNVGSAGAPVLNGGALGTPSSGVATNLTGTASGLTAGNVTTNANLTGDVTSVGNAATVVKINGTSLAGLATGIVKNTTSTGVPSIAIAADFPTLNQSTTGSAATLTTPRAIYGNNFDGSAALTGIIASTYGGTGNGFAKFNGPTTAERTFTLPDASATLVYSGGPLGTPSSGVGTNLTGTASGLTAGTATALATGRTIAVTGDLAYTSPSFDGSGNVTAAGTLATVNSNVGSFTNANITVNAKGLVTAAANGSAGAGTVTATAGSLTSNAVVLGAGTTDTKVSTGITTDGAGKVVLGVAGSTVGSVDFKNATSGTITVQPTTGALGTVTLTLPAVTDTVAVKGANTFTASQQLTSGTSLNWNADTLLSRRAAATIQHGDADAAAPVAQTVTFQGARGGTDSNTAAVTATIQGSLGTGTGTVGNLVLSTGTVAASGTTQHTAAARLTLNSTSATFAVPVAMGTNSITSTATANRFGSPVTNDTNADTIMTASGTTKRPLVLQGSRAAGNADPLFAVENSADAATWYTQLTDGTIRSSYWALGSGSAVVAQDVNIGWTTANASAGTLVSTGSIGVWMSNSGTGAGRMIKLSNDTAGATGAMLQNTGGRQRVNADVTNSTTTMAAITGLSFNVLASGKYTGRVMLRVDDTVAAEGIKFDFGAGNATMTSFWAIASIKAGGTAVAGTQEATSLTGAMNFTTITNTTYVEIDFSLVVNAAGTVALRFAQDSHTAGTATVRLGSFTWAESMP